MDTQFVAWDEEIQRRRTVLLSRLLMVIAVVGLIGLIVYYVTWTRQAMSAAEALIQLLPFGVAWLLILLTWVFPGLGYHVRAVLLIALAFVVGMIIFARGGLVGSGRVWLVIPPILTFVLIDARSGIIAGIVSGLSYFFFAIAIGQGWVVPQASESLITMSALMSQSAIFVGVITILLAVLWTYDRGFRDAFTGMRSTSDQLQDQTQELSKVNERLRLRALQLQTAADVAYACSSILDLEALLSEMVLQVQEGFRSMGVYYVGLFLVDEARQFAELRAATGEAGKLLLGTEYKLRMDETSTVGWSILRQQARIALDVGKDGEEFGHPLLGPTRSELALPLRSRDRTLGALSIQSTREVAFNEADIAVLQMMVDQMAVAIDNANLLSRTEAALEEVQTVHQQYLERAWREFLESQPVTQVDYSRPGTEPSRHGRFLYQARRKAMESGQVVAIEGSLTEGQESLPPMLVIPLRLRGQAVGTITIQQELRRQRAWGDEDIAFAETIAEQVALTVENMRLMDETQRRAASESLISEVTARMRASLDMETMLKNAVQEIGQKMGLTALDLRLVSGLDSDDAPRG